MNQKRKRLLPLSVLANVCKSNREWIVTSSEDLNVDLKLLFLKLNYGTWLVGIIFTRNKSCLTQKRDIKVIQNTIFSKNAKLKCRERCEPQKRKFHVGTQQLEGVQSNILNTVSGSCKPYQCPKQGIGIQVPHNLFHKVTSRLYWFQLPRLL